MKKTKANTRRVAIPRPLLPSTLLSAAAQLGAPQPKLNLNRKELKSNRPSCQSGPQAAC